MGLEIYGSGDLYAMGEEPIYTINEDKEIILDELENEYAYLMRQYEEFLSCGKSGKAQEILKKSKEIEDLIKEMESED